MGRAKKHYPSVGSTGKIVPLCGVKARPNGRPHLLADDGQSVTCDACKIFVTTMLRKQRVSSYAKKDEVK